MGIPLFHVGLFPEDFSGRLYFVLGQGLGDHVNGFRILVEVQKRFPRATCIVYADLRWEELVRRIDGIEIRWYPKALDVRSKKGTNNPYELARETIRKEIAADPGRGFLACAHFPMPDRHARQETTLEATARAIGLSLGESARPYLSLLPSDRTWADGYLKKHGLEKGRYAVVAPFTWPNKSWSKENFSALIDLLFRKYGIRTIVASYPQIGPFANEGAVCAFDLTLGQLAGLLSVAGVYVGLDSGPTHMAASFDLPMVVIYIERKVIPFEVRPLSPRALLVVESFFNPVPVPGVQTVADSVGFILGKGNPGRLSGCPVCERPMNYVVRSDSSAIRLMCSCGLAVDQDFSKAPRGEPESDRNREGQGRETLKNSPLDLGNVIGTVKSFYWWNDFTEEESPDRIEFLVQEGNDELSAPLESGKLIFWIDSYVIWMKTKGYLLIGCGRVTERKNGRGTIKKARLGFDKNDRAVSSDRISLPWGSAHLHVRVDEYLRWYSFGRWTDPNTLVGIVKAQTELGFGRRERVLCAWTAFRSRTNLRSFRWLIKTIFM